MPISRRWSQNLTAFVGEWKRKSDSREFIGDKYLGDNPLKHFVVLDEVESWESFLVWNAELKGCWIFRGQREASWSLETSLDRAVTREINTLDSYSLYHLDRKTEMQALLYRFQQYAHTYLSHVPALDDFASWYALMQHHCAPTPLLDWTELPYVAMYFALENKANENSSKKDQNQSAVWAVDSDWLDSRGRQVLHEKGIPLPADGASLTGIAERTNLVLKEANAPCLIRINPAMSNSRMFAQRGLFLCKLVEQASVGQLLMSMVMHPTLTIRPVIRKLKIGNRFRIEFLKHLRAMNIHRASLFPGLDGLGLSLKLDLELKERK